MRGGLLPELREHERPRQLRELVNRYGDCMIDSIIISRRPIPQVLERLANIVTRGRFERNKKLGTNVDKYFHTYIKILANCNGVDKFILIEKNERVKVSFEDINKHPEEKSIVLRRVPKMTVKEFIDRGEEWAIRNNKPLYIYDAIEANCQLYIEWMLRGNRLWSHSYAPFVLQDVRKAVEPWLHGITRKVTDLAAKLDIIFKGRGN